MACIYNCKKPFCTEPLGTRIHLTKLLCGELSETVRQKQAPNRLDYFTEIDNTFDALFVNRGDTVNLGKCTFIKKRKNCSKCHQHLKRHKKN